MRSITFDDWSNGLDVRRGASSSDPNRMRVLTNAYITTGKVIRKRPGTELIETFSGAEAGTVGLYSGLGKLHTFVIGSPAGHGNTLFKMNRADNPDLSSSEITAVNYADVFDGYMYASIEYDDGSDYHHWLDLNRAEKYKNKYYIVGETVRANNNNGGGLLHVCTTTSPTVDILSFSVANNTVITTDGNHGLVNGDDVYISGVEITTATFVAKTIDSIYPGDDAIVFCGGHGKVAGDFVYISGITSGVFSGKINTLHVVKTVLTSFAFTIETSCSEISDGGTLGKTDPNGKHVVIAATADTITIGVECSVTDATGTVSIPAGSEPTWSVIEGGTATAGDGITTFTATSMVITDTECPHSKAFTVSANKVWAIDDDVVRASRVADATVWDASLDFLPGVILPVSSHASGSSETTAISQYQGRLAVFFPDAVQFWDVDPDPAQDQYYKTVDGLGTMFYRTPTEFAGDILFLAKSGFRSITTLYQGNDNLAESDVGSAIDSLVRPQTEIATNPVTAFYNKDGQYWCAMSGVSGVPVWAYTFSRTQKISAWALYEYPFEIEYMAVVGSELYLRSGESVYKVDSSEDVFTDDGTEFEMRIEMPFLDFKKPSSTKYIASMDVVFDGTCDVQFRFDPNDATAITDPITLTGDTRPYQSIPVEITTSGISPVFTSTSDEDFKLESVTFHYEELGPV